MPRHACAYLPCSTATYYYRPCCDGSDPGDFCNVSKAKWLIVFGHGNRSIAHNIERARRAY